MNTLLQLSKLCYICHLLILQSVAVSNPRYRRSRSAGVMVDHQAANAVPTNTIMQPSNLKKKRSVTKLSERDLLDPKTSNYALTTQEQDSDGDIVTTIYKVHIFVFQNYQLLIMINCRLMSIQLAQEDDKLLSMTSKR